MLRRMPFPDVAVGVDEPGEDDHPGGIDHLGAVDCQTWPDRGYPVVFDENVGFGEVADLPVEREHDPALDQLPPRRHHPEVGPAG